MATLGFWEIALFKTLKAVWTQNIVNIAAIDVTLYCFGHELI